MNYVGFIETTSIHKQQLPLIDYHAKRLQESMFLANSIYTLDDIKDKINRLLFEQLNKHPSANKCRFLVEFFPLKTTIEEKWTLELNEVPFNLFDWNENGVRLTHYTAEVVLGNDFPNCKINDRKIYNNALQFAKHNNFDDALISKSDNYIADASIYNIYVLKHNIVYTPPLKDLPINGVARKFILENANQLPFAIEEKSITKKDLLEADALFTSNALRGIQAVKQFDNQCYNISLIKPLHEVWCELLKNNIF